MLLNDCSFVSNQYKSNFSSYGYDQMLRRNDKYLTQNNMSYDSYGGLRERNVGYYPSPPIRNIKIKKCDVIVTSTLDLTDICPARTFHGHCGYNSLVDR